MKQLGAWATASWGKFAHSYTSDVFFRTAVHIVALQVGFVLVCMGALLLVATYAQSSIVMLGLLFVAAVAAAGLLIRFSLRPARDNLRHQKLFISNVAHELRTPLSIIKTTSEVALFDESLEPEIKASFQEIIGELNRVSEIINNLLSLNALARPERMQFKNLDLIPLAESVTGRYQALARERKIKLLLRTETGSIVWGNATGLEQVMSNLVKNALSYTPRDSGGSVSVTLRPQEGMVLFAVEDNGVGISQEELLHIFEPFYRADSSRNRKGQEEGSGLGLTIVNEMVRVHRGKIHVESRRKTHKHPGGTTVSVLLPLGGAAARAAQELNKTSLDFSGHSHNNMNGS
ncbi:MAG: sensor histidine kinase [Candidatus Adlerbacteria bacterium]|nr:sensor histidine kinase [Candidatus Adlerbacteria bacterium]